MFVNKGRSFNSAANVPVGRALNAASVGANNVNGPGPDKVPPSPQESIAISNNV